MFEPRRLVGFVAAIAIFSSGMIGCGDDESDARGSGAGGIGSELRTPGAIATVMGTVTGRSTGSAGAQGAEAQLCGDLHSLALAVMDFRSLSASSTVEELTDAKDNIEAASEDVKSSAEDIEQATVDALDDAVNGLGAAAADIAGDDSIGEAYASLLPSISAIEVALDDFDREVTCP